LHIPLDRFATSEVATLKGEGLPEIKISYTSLAQFLNKAERLQSIRQPALRERSIGKKSSRQTKKRRRPPTPTEQLSSDRENEFCDAESKMEGRTVVEDKDFQDQTRSGTDILEMRKSRRTR